MPRSARASASSMSSIRFEKKNQPSHISRSSGSPSRSAASASALPAPNQPGSMYRHCDQACAHGIERSASMPVRSAREVGREPICMRSITSIGATWRKKSANSASS